MPALTPIPSISVIGLLHLNEAQQSPAGTGTAFQVPFDQKSCRLRKSTLQARQAVYEQVSTERTDRALGLLLEIYYSGYVTVDMSGLGMIVGRICCPVVTQKSFRKPTLIGPHLQQTSPCWIVITRS